MNIIKWSAVDKMGDPIPWPYNPNCKCRDWTEYVVNPKDGFNKAKTFCNKCLPKEFRVSLNNTENNLLSEKICEKERLNIKAVREKKIKESQLLDYNYISD